MVAFNDQLAPLSFLDLFNQKLSIFLEITASSCTYFYSQILI